MGFFDWFKKKKKKKTPEPPKPSPQELNLAQEQQMDFQEDVPGVPKEKQWQFDCLLQFLTSPLWKSPIYSFMDENCLVFDSDEENKFSYTDIHNAFKKTIEEILEGFIQDIGLAQEDFVMIVKAGISNPEHKKIFEQLLLIDNFLVFKKLMVKRNKQLELECIKALEGQGQQSEQMQVSQQMQQFGTNTDLQRSLLENEEAELNAAIAQSQQLHNERQKMLMDDAEIMRRVMEESKKEHETWVAKQKAEQQAQKEQHEKLMQHQKQQQIQAQQQVQAQQEDQIKKDNEMKQQKLLAEQQRQQAEQQRLKQLKEQEEMMRKKQQQKQQKMQEEEKKEEVVPKKQRKALPTPGQSSLQNAPPLSSVIGTQDLTYLQKQKLEVQKRLQQIKQMEQNKPQQLKQPTKQTKGETLAERKKRLKAQRDKILARKKKQREAEMNKFRQKMNMPVKQEEKKPQPKPQQQIPQQPQKQFQKQTTIQIKQEVEKISGTTLERRKMHQKLKSLLVDSDSDD